MRLPVRGILLSPPVSLLCGACAFVSAKPFFSASDATPGIRFYEPTPFLVVTDKDAQIVLVPNPNRGVAVGFSTWVARHNFQLEAQQGQLTRLSSDADTTALASGLLTLVQTIGAAGIQNAAELAKLMGGGVQALGEKVTGSIPECAGVFEFRFDEKGEFRGLHNLMEKPAAAARPEAPPK